MKKVIKLSIAGLFFIYLMLFVSYKGGYYEKLNKERTQLTEEMILKYEEDLANGIDVTTKDYTIPKNSYSNVYTRMSLKLAKKLESTMDSSIKFVFRKINDLVDE